MVFVAIVAVVAVVMTAGAAAMALGTVTATTAGASVGVMSAGAAVLAGGTAMGVTVSFGAAGALGLMAAAATAGAVGSIVSQGAAMAMGMQDHFSWSQVGVSALGAAVTSGIGGGAFGDALKAQSIAVRAMAGSALTQGIEMATGLQHKFDWTGVMAAGAATWASSQVSPFGEQPAQGGWGSFGNGLSRSLVSGGLQSAIDTGHQPNWGAIAAQSFGSELGNSVVDSIAEQDGQYSKMLAAEQDRGDELAEQAGREYLASAREPANVSLNQQSQQTGVGFSWTATSQQEIYAKYAKADAFDPWGLKESLSGPVSNEPSTVRAGDYGGSYFRVARAQLGPGASNADVMRYAAQLVELNSYNPRVVPGSAQLVLPDGNTPEPTYGQKVINGDIKYGEALKAWRAQQAALLQTQQAQAATGVYACGPNDPLPQQRSVAEALGIDARNSLIRSTAMSAVENTLRMAPKYDGPVLSQWDGMSTSERALMNRQSEQAEIATPALFLATGPVGGVVRAVGIAASANQLGLGGGAGLPWPVRRWFCECRIWYAWDAGWWENGT
jgi:hypothetical protein